MNSSNIKTRFAPSPTGYLHIGGLRTALYAYLYARQNNGEFLLRIEDTDQTRLVEDSMQNILDTLAWAGLSFDNPKPVVQSTRLEIYQEYAQKLIDTGHAYRCFCTKDQLDTMREEQTASKKAPMYDRRCRYLSQKEIQRKLDEKTPFVIRQAIPLNQTVKWIDKIRQKTVFDTNTLDDHVLLKTDQFPTYHLAVVIDDHLMQITDVIRGEEWLPSTPKHLLLYQSFGWTPPSFAHLPLLLNKDRSKLSKRQNDVSTQSYIDKGYLKEALINFIAMLGWNTNDNQEIYSMQDLISQFSLERVQKSGAIFDLDKLNWYNWQWKRLKYLDQLKKITLTLDPNASIQEEKKGKLQITFTSNQSANLSAFHKQQTALLLQEITPFLTPENQTNLQQNPSYTQKILLLLEDKILKEPQEINHHLACFFTQNFNYNLNLFLNPKMQVTHEIAVQSLQQTLTTLKPEHFASETDLLEIFKQIIAQLNLKNGQLLWPIRVALSNQEFSPGVFELAYALEYKTTINRLQQALAALTNSQ